MRCLLLRSWPICHTMFSDPGVTAWYHYEKRSCTSEMFGTTFLTSLNDYIFERTTMKDVRPPEMQKTATVDSVITHTPSVDSKSYGL